jgi:CheY-like chemotaxis protein
VPSLRILVVEDDDALALFYKEALGDLGHEVRVARNGLEGLAALERDVDLVVTDVGMPLMSGDEMVERMRARPEHHRTPVLVLTARPDTFPELDRDVAAVVHRKPFPLERLYDFVEEASRARR